MHLQVLTQLTEHMITIIATAFCGYFGKMQLGAVALANLVSAPRSRYYAPL